MTFPDHFPRNTQELMGAGRRMAKTKKSAVTTTNGTTSAENDHQQIGAAQALPAASGTQGLIPPTLVICRNKYAHSGMRFPIRAPVTDKIIGTGDIFPPTMVHGSIYRAKCLKA